MACLVTSALRILLAVMRRTRKLYVLSVVLDTQLLMYASRMAASLTSHFLVLFCKIFFSTIVQAWKCALPGGLFNSLFVWVMHFDNPTYFLHYHNLLTISCTRYGNLKHNN